MNEAEEPDRSALLRRLPSVDRCLRLQEGVPGPLAREAARRLLESLRGELLAGGRPDLEALFEDRGLAGALAEVRRRLETPAHRRVVNATGILLHTGLGRAPLPRAARAALVEVSGQALVEVDPESGKRGRRERAVAALLRRLTGAEAALVVNNNAAATLLALDALARGGEVPVSRGELVEIGGGFRMPEVMAQAGCRLVEVGSTNRTRLDDYARAIGPETRALLKVHPSNFRIEGFTASVPLADLVTLGEEHGLPVLEDQGSGYLLQEPLPHDGRERPVSRSLEEGAALVCFSGDKLLGSCQAGLLAGRKEAVDRAASHPLYRALRCDKCQLAALEATLRIYLHGNPKEEIPVLRAIFRPLEELEAEGEALVKALAPAARSLSFEAVLRPSPAYVGSGATPARSIASLAVVLGSTGGGSPRELARRLRLARPSIWGRVEEDALWLDLRSLEPGDAGEVVRVFEGFASGGDASS